jgi:uncharacterized protein (TIGR04141 family)
MSRKSKSRILTIFLLKPDLNEPAQILKPRKALSEIPVNIEGEEQGTLFFQPSENKQPAWLSLFRGAVDVDFKNAYNASTAAVWLLHVGEKQLAIAFGYGRNMLRPGVYEENFGLKITLNAVDSNKIKSLDRMTLDAIAQQSRIQASRDAALSEFGLDLEQDLLRAVTGTPLEPELGLRLTGRDALQVTVAVELPEVPRLMERYLREFEKEAYKARFPWVDHIHEVEDPVRRADLDLELLQRLRANNLDRLWLCLPEIMDWEGLGGFKYRNAKNARLHQDIHVQTFLEEVDDPKDLDEYMLKQRYQVCALATETEAVVRHWPVYNCLYCEVDSGSDTFLLNNGRWFRIATGFIARINEAVEKIPAPPFDLPSYSDSSEGSYSKRVSESDDGHFALMDRKLVGSISLPNAIEFCDLYSDGKQIVHLKRYSGSSTLSHLFAQAVVSAKVFLNETDFRHELNNILPHDYRLNNPASKPNATEFEIVFGIISKSKNKLVLPFFSRVNLKNANSNLLGMGFRVSICKIQAE